MAEQIEAPIPIISLEEYQQARKRGVAIDPQTLVLMPVHVLQAEEQRWTEVRQRLLQGIEQVFAKHQVSLDARLASLCADVCVAEPTEKE